VKIKIGKLRVDVRDPECPKRPCYQLGYDKGYFTAGRGYDYHRDSKPHEPLGTISSLRSTSSGAGRPALFTSASRDAELRSAWALSGIRRAVSRQR